MSYIAAITTAVPAYCHKQKDTALFYANTTNDPNTQRKINVVAQKSGIEQRYSILKDFSTTVVNDLSFFAQNSSLQPMPTITQRMAVYKQEALQLALAVVLKIKNFKQIKNTITHVISVTCTGLFAPGLDIELIQHLKLSPTTQRSSVNFMGCNAAILALKQADAICNSTPNATVLVVCVELCTLHFQTDYSDDYIVSNMLFADGAAATLITTNAPQAPYYKGVKITNFNSLLVHKGSSDMAWQLSETGFVMNLSSYVSSLINGEMQQLLAALNIDVTSVDNWAIHPGGKKILDEFCTTLQLHPQQLQASYEILRNYGNMSSVTILFVLQQIIQNKTGSNIFVAGFGPGLSIETMRINYV